MNRLALTIRHVIETLSPTVSRARRNESVPTRQLRIEQLASLCVEDPDSEANVGYDVCT